MKQKQIKKTIVGAAAAAAVLSGTAVLAENYQSGNHFKPSGSDQDIQANQVVFPEDENRAGETDRSQKDNSSLWEKDDTSGDQGSQNQNGGGYLFEGDELAANTENTLNLADSSGNLSMVPDMNGGNTVYDMISDASRADQIIGSGGSHSSGSSSNKGNSGTANKGNSGNQKPNGENGGSAAVRPSASAKDPELTHGSKNNPTLGDSDWPYINQPYQEGFTPITDEDGNPVVWIKKADGSGNDGIKLYEGQSVTEKELYYSLDTYVLGANFNRYLWGADALNKYVRIDGISFDGGATRITDFPVTIPFGLQEGQMIIYVSYRFSATSDKWIEMKYENAEGETVPGVPYDAESSRIFVLSQEIEEENSVITADMLVNPYNQYFSEGSKVNLLRYQYDFLGVDDTVLTSLFPGWTEDGKLVPWLYPVKAGRHILEPARMVPLSDGYTVKIKLYWLDDELRVDPDSMNLSYLQTLTNYESDTLIARAASGLGVQSRYGVKLQVPEYVQAVDFEEGASVIVEHIEIPDTVLYINTDGAELQVYQSWKVDKDNPNYASTEDGMLMDKEETKILGIPEHISEIRIPDSIASVKLTRNNRLTRIHMESDSVESMPELEFDNLSNCTIVVKDELLEEYINAHQEELTEGDHLSVAAESDPEKNWWIENDVLISSDGELGRSMDSGSVVRVPESVKTICKNAFAGSRVTTLVLPEEQDELILNEDCFAGSAVQKVLCHTERQYEAVKRQIEKSGAGEELQVELMLTSREGFSYSRERKDGVETVTLLTAPADIREFYGTVTAEDGTPVTITAIGDNAFAGCEELQWVELPESIKRIGYQAFRNCTSLEGLLIDARDEIHIGNKSLDGCSALRFVASNAHYGEMEDGYAPKVTDSYGTALYTNYYFYVPSDPEGYGPTCVSFGEGDNVAEYRVESIGEEGRMLYGVGSDGAPWLALRSGLQVAEQVKLPESTVEVYRYAMADTRTASGDSYTVNWDELSELSYLDAGAFRKSFLGGTVTITNASVGDEVFYSCTRVQELSFPGTMKYLGNSVFGGCSSLTKVTFGNTRGGFGTIGLTAGEFTGCDSLRELHFDGSTLISLDMETRGYGYQFNSDWTQEEEKGKLRLYLSNAEPEDFVKEYRYLFAGYYDTSVSTAYAEMWTSEYWNRVTYDEYWNLCYPEEAEVDAAVKEALLTAENRIRVMLGLAEVAEPVDFYPYHTDDLGYMTLVGAPSDITEVTLDEATLDLPEGWSIDYIGTGAFSGSKKLQKLIIPETADAAGQAGTVIGIYPNAFAGVESDLLTVEFKSRTPVELFQEDEKPFSFGLGADHLRLIVPEGSEEDYLYSFLWPMAGYEGEQQMRTQIIEKLTEEQGDTPSEADVDARMQQELLPVYNSLRSMMGLDSRDRVDILSTAPAEEVPEENGGAGDTENRTVGSSDGEADRDTDADKDADTDKEADKDTDADKDTEADKDKKEDKDAVKDTEDTASEEDTTE